MMKNRWTMLLASLVLAVSTALADLPFRNHRYDGFTVLPVSSQNIVFIGNSITNMHEWWESFGNHNVINRGTSGAVADEMLANLEAILPGKPAKVFLMIGTNDLGTSGMNTAPQVAAKVRLALKRLAKESPATEVYVQSILPSTQRNQVLQRQTNDSLRHICAETGVTYIDLWDDLMGITSGSTLSYDGLHLTAQGYRIWCNRIAPYVGSECAYPADAVNQNGGLGRSEGMRVTTFGMSLVKADDILIIGDEMVHGGEWHELLHSARVKSRGNGWGYPGTSLSGVNAALEAIFKGRPDNAAPAKAFFYAATSDVNNASNTIESIAANYRAMIEKARTLAPTTTLYVMGLLPQNNASTNTSRIKPLNALLKTMAAGMDNVEYVDVYTPMEKDGTANTAYFNGNYVYGKGYAKLSQLLAPYMGEGVTPTSDDDAQQLIDRFTARTSLASAVNFASSLKIGTGPGAYTAENAAALLAGVEEAYDLLSGNLGNEELAAKGAALGELVNALLPKINQPALSTQGDEHWFKLYTPNRGSRYMTSNGAGAGVTGDGINNYARSMWKFVARGDGSLDIVNRADGSYLNSAAAFNSQISTSASAPAAGWTLSYSDAVGTYIISSGNVQLNQTQAGQNYALFNWSNGGTGTDRSDTGCQFAIEEVDGLPAVEPCKDPVVTLRDIELDGTAPYKVADDEAAKVFALDEALTVAIDVTLSNATGDQMLVSSSNSASGNFMGVSINNGSGIRVHTGGGYYTRGNFSQERHQIVVTMQKQNPTAGYYVDGVDIAQLNIADLSYFGAIEGVNGLYLGGTATNTSANYMPATGTIHSVRFYNHALSAEEIAALNYNLDESSENPVVTLRDIELGGTAPYKVADDEAAKVFALDEALTVAVDMTLSSATGDQMLVSSSNSASDDFMGVSIYNGGGVRMHTAGGFYTRNATIGTQRHQIVVTMQKKNPSYVYYVDGTQLSAIAIADQNLFGSIAGVNGLYLGGTVTASSANHLPAAGTIHSVRFYNRALTAEEVAALDYNLDEPGPDEPGPDEPAASGNKWYTMQIGSSGYYISDPGTAASISLTKVDSKLADADLWRFEGDDKNGYRIYNMAAGEDKVLAAPATVTSANEATAYVTLKDKNNLGGYRDLWKFTVSNDLGEDTPAYYMYPAGSEKDKVNIRDSKLAFWTSGADHGSSVQIRFAQVTYEVNDANGTFTASNGNKTWHQIWTANATEPGFVLDAGANNMIASDGHIVGYVGQYAPQTYTLRADEGYRVKSFSFDFVSVDNPATAVTVTAGGKTLTASTEDQHVAADVAVDDTPYGSFILGGPNKGIVFKNFYVTIIRSEEVPEPQFEVFPSPAGAIPYRIPAITRAHNGDIIAVADYRHSRADIGMAHNGRIDLHARISSDNGQTWGEIFPIVEGKGAASPDFMHVGFGDPCIVADRESDRVLVMSCAGNVSFPGGQRDNHQNIARFYSEDNGQTWSEPVDIAESIYSQFDESPFGPVRAMFVGSGKISQSRTIKVGDYYRLYCAVLLKDKNGSNINFVLYSDDFGGSWTVLGGTDVTPIPSGGDEPKAEELPDGSVIISSRAQGRLFNIFTYTDVAKGKGHWGTMTQSLASSNGGICAQGGNPTNGEIMILPATRKADGAEVWIALQSVPFGPNRANVGIYYKELDGLSDFATPADIAKDWDGRHQSSHRSSAYSTMTWQADNTLGFIYEEDLYSCSGGYTIVYKNYSLEQITDSAYTYNPDNTRSVFTETDAIRAKVDELIAHVGTNVGNLTAGGAASLESAYEAYAEQPGQEAYVALNAALSDAERVEIDPARFYRVRNSDRQGGTLYLTAKTDASGMTAATLNEQSDDQLFQFVPAGDGKWQICNRGRKFYVGSTGGQEVEIPVSAEQSEAAPYRVDSEITGLSALVCLTPAGRPAIHLAGDCARLVPWNATGSPASLWYIEPTDIQTDIQLIAQPGASLEAAPLYDLSGRRVTAPQRGIYIRAGRKQILR